MATLPHFIYLRLHFATASNLDPFLGLIINGNTVYSNSYYGIDVGMP